MGREHSRIDGSAARAPHHPQNPPMPTDPPLRYLAGYPEHLQAQVRGQLAQGRVGELLRQRYAAVNPVHRYAPHGLPI